MNSGVYILKFKGTDKVYIGQSQDMYKRFREHCCSFRLQKASNKLQKAYQEYGYPEMEVLLECSGRELIIHEEECIQIYNSYTDGFNSMPSSGYYEKPNDISPLSNTDRDTVIKVFLMLIDPKYPSYQIISNTTGVSEMIVTQIARGYSHTWLSIHYPSEYATLISLRGSRKLERQKLATSASTSTKYTKEQYIYVLSLLVSENKLKHPSISKLTGVKVDVIRDISSLRRHKWLEVACPTEYHKLKQLKLTKGN